jgi:hypothetical protein
MVVGHAKALHFLAYEPVLSRSKTRGNLLS